MKKRKPDRVIDVAKLAGYLMIGSSWKRVSSSTSIEPFKNLSKISVVNLA